MRIGVVFQRCQGVFTDVQPQICFPLVGIGSVALKTTVRKQGPDMKIEINRITLARHGAFSLTGSAEHQEAKRKK